MLKMGCGPFGVLPGTQNKQLNFKLTIHDVKAIALVSFSKVNVFLQKRLCLYIFEEIFITKGKDFLGLHVRLAKIFI